ncbi:hypothetical protein J0S82_010365 [Galemys pyrenaicus]|uniref:Uncharacterized protein n=1 Tax=Galemys pyrenaicus TaxID=202257 RepID=A0A8J5ZIZ2_GALPY|nr:hypothetical protein J0S82_010365 [Galemys pyrenaicus]
MARLVGGREDPGPRGLALGDSTACLGPQGRCGAGASSAASDSQGRPSHFRMRGAKLTGALLALAGLLHVALSLKIAAFNIRTFGDTKMSNATLSNYIVQVSPGSCLGGVLGPGRLPGTAHGRTQHPAP